MRKIKVILPTIIIALLFLNVILSILIAGKGAQIASIENLIAQASARTKVAQDRVVSGSSLSQLQLIAPQLGFISGESIIYWSSDAGQLAKSQ